MGNQLVRGRTYRNPVNLDQLSEMEILSDIEYFRGQLENLPVETDRYTRARRQVYVTLLQQRRRLLAAVRAGRPEDWPEFPLD